MLKQIPGHAEKKVEINSTIVIVAAILFCTIGPQTVMLLPGFVQGLVQYMGFTDQQAGFITSSEITGMTLGTIAIIYLVSRSNWRILFGLSLLLIVTGNLLSILINEFYTLCGIRFLAGIGAGSIVSLSFMVIGLTAKSDRNFALSIFFVVLYGVIVFPLLPVLFNAAGMVGLLLFVAAYAALGLPFVRYMPSFGEEHLKLDENAVEIDRVRKFLALAAMLIFFAANFAVWAYFFRMGVVAGISEQSIANSLSISAFFGMAGAFTCAFVGARFGRAPALTIGILGCAVPITFMLGSVAALSYTVIVCAFHYFWAMTHPYLLAAMASFDPTGKMVVYATAMQYIGTSLGPTIGALLVDGDSYQKVIYAGITLLVVSLLLIFPPVIRESQLASHQ